MVEFVLWDYMIAIELTKMKPEGPGLYLMSWKGKLGLIRVVHVHDGEELKILKPDSPNEYYHGGVTSTMSLPDDAYYSDKLLVSTE